MGQPKLLLPLGGETVISLCLRTLRPPEIAATLVVVRRDDQVLSAAASREGAIVVQPEVDPPDMRTSVKHALREIQERWDPQPEDAWLLSPADHPALDVSLIRTLATRWQQTAESVLVPTHAGRRGHPTIFAWKLYREVDAIPEGEGLNWLVRRQQVAELPVDSSGIFDDLDTPEDYSRMQSRWVNQLASGES